MICTSDIGAEQPLLVALHGRGSSAEEMRLATGLDRRAAVEGMAVVFAEALDGGWGDDTFVTASRPAGDEDVRGLDEVVAAARRHDLVGDTPVVVVGFSNGASMAMRYAGARPDDVRAVVSIAGQLPRDPPVRPTARTPLLQVYGSADPIRPIDAGIPETATRAPGDPTPTLSTQESVEAFISAAGPGPFQRDVDETDPVADDGTSVRTESWRDALGLVAVYHLVVGGGHTWPSADQPFTGGDRFGTTSRDLDATDATVRFAIDTLPDP